MMYDAPAYCSWNRTPPIDDRDRLSLFCYGTRLPRHLPGALLDSLDRVGSGWGTLQGTDECDYGSYSSICISTQALCGEGCRTGDKKRPKTLGCAWLGGITPPSRGA
jgi:hypothetical protein